MCYSMEMDHSKVILYIKLRFWPRIFFPNGSFIRFNSQILNYLDLEENIPISYYVKSSCYLFDIVKLFLTEPPWDLHRLN